MNYFESSKETLKKKDKNFEEKDYYNELIDRYEVNDKEENSTRTSLFVRRQRKNNYLPFIFYIFLITILLFLGLFGFVIFNYLSTDLNYNSYDNCYEKPSLSIYNYTKLEFNNGLEVLLVQTGENEMASGTITFDASYLDSRYKFGYLNLTLYTISRDILKHENLSQYLGDTTTSKDENSYSISFKILNAGFFQYLKTWKNIIFLEKNDNRFNETNLNNSADQVSKGIQRKNYRKKEEDILKYFVYGFQNILPKNDKEFLKKVKIDEIKNISESLLKPEKIKIVLASHFKPSLMKKKFLKYFENIINAKKEEKKSTINNSPNIYENKNFSKQKIIYFYIEDNIENYIKINYYIDKNKDESYEEFYEKQGYFNYLKYILDQNSEGSLIHILTNNPNFTIKYLSSEFKIILKDKIEFSIKISLAPSSYKYLGDIIFLTYQYMNKLIKHISKSNSEDERLKELEKIINQYFIFQEDDKDKMDFTRNLCINLCDKKNKKLFLKNKWMPSFKYEDIKNFNYFSQLIPENSIIILALSKNNTKEVENNNSKFKFDINQFNKSTIPFYDIFFNYFNFDIDFTKYFNENEEIPFKKNDYISEYQKKIDIDEKDKNDFNYHSIILRNTNISHFTFIRDTRFELPKVHISLNLLHPFLRPGNQLEFRDCYYFESLLYLAYIDREIKFKLSDAIRAGNIIRVGFNQNHLFVEIFAFSDVAEKILKKIKEIMLDKKSFEEIHNFDDINKFKLYEHYAYENFLAGTAKVKKAKYLFYYGLNEKIYNRTYDLKLEDIKNENCTKEFIDTSKLMTNFLIDGQIYGYYDQSEAEKIANLFDELENDEIQFLSVLDKAGLSKENLTASTFRQWIRKENINEIKTIKKHIIIEDNKNETEKRNRYIFIYWDDYTIINRVKSNIFKKIIQNKFQKSKEYDLNLEIIYYNNIFLEFHLYFYKPINKSESESERIIEELRTKISQTIVNNAEYYNQYIDSIGNRMYYLIKSMKELQYIRTRDMTSSAKNNLHSEFYTSDDYTILKEATNTLNYDSFLNLPSKITKKYYIEIY